MGRIIKTYPYSSTYKDEIQASAEFIKDFDLMGVSMDYIDLKNGDITETRRVRFNSLCYAKEESFGVHVYLQEVDAQDNPTGYKTPEIIVDEIEFVDETYKCLTGAYGKKISLDKSQYIQDLLYNLARQYAMDKLDEQKLFFQTQYTGIGYIFAGNSLISVADIMTFAENTVIFDHCVGRVSSDEDISVMFWTGKDNKQCLNFKDIALEGTYNDGNTYKYVFKINKLIEFSGDLAPEIPPTKFSEDIEKFVKERTDIINSADQEEEKKDDMLDLL